MIRKDKNLKVVTRPRDAADINQSLLIGFVGYNCWDLTKAAIASIVSNCKKVKVVYVDNGSIPDVIEEVKTYKPNNRFVDEFEYIIRKENCVAGAWNDILNAAYDHDYDKVVICNNDILFATCTLDNLVEAYDKIRKEDPNTVLVSASNRMRDPTRLEEAKPIWEHVEHPDFSCFILDSKDRVDRFGAFEELYKPAFFEDNHHHWKILLQGYKAYNTSWAPYCHLGSKTRFANPDLITHQMFRDARSKFAQTMNTVTVDQTVPDYRYAQWLKDNPGDKHPSYSEVNQWCEDNDKLYPPNYEPPKE